MKVMQENFREGVPKIIHYVWVGGKPLPPLAQQCIQSWKKHLPDYEVRFWNEQNAPMDHKYVHEMYRQKKWAFVSDYIRFWALEREGGVYLDTDMELLRPLDDLLEDSFFVGRSKSGDIESSIIASVAHHSVLRDALAFYDRDTEFSIKNTSPRVLARVCARHPDQIRVYDADYFHPCDEGERCTSTMLAHAYARHHWAESWVPFARTRKILRRMGTLGFLKKFKRILYS